MSFFFFLFFLFFFLGWKKEEEEIGISIYRARIFSLGFSAALRFVATIRTSGTRSHLSLFHFNLTKSKYVNTWQKEQLYLILANFVIQSK